MIEILFKAKRIDNGEWIEGQYVYFKNPKAKNGKPVKHFIGNGTTIFNDEIDPSTLCQYTGLKDKNGKRIWENDIVRSGVDMIVKWNKKYAGWCLASKKWMYEHFFGEAVNEKECEVIGNIFDTREQFE